MLIKEIIHRQPVTISPETKLFAAYELMLAKNIRHLPVVKNNKLVGIITDRDLRAATSKLAEIPFQPEDEVEKIMVRNVITIHPLDPIDIAAKLMREHKIGCLPVLENEIIIGIVTISDMLDALLKLTGVHRPSGRLEINLSDKPGELAKLAGHLAERKVNIHSILTYPAKDGKIRIVLRISTIDIRGIAESLCNSGFEIIWPPQMSCAE